MWREVVLACTLFGLLQARSFTHAPREGGLADIFDLMALARAKSKPVMDLEETTPELESPYNPLPLTRYETLLHDAIFEFLIKVPTISLEKLKSMETAKTIATDFDEPLLSKNDLLKNRMDCLPPLRVLGEALQTFDMYSQGQDKIDTNALQKAYKAAFKQDLSDYKAGAMLRGMQYNPRAEDTEAEVTRCEFVKSYMEQRKFIDFKMISDVEPMFSQNWYAMNHVVGLLNTASIKEEYTEFLNELFRLDRGTGEDILTKCETALTLASCRMHQDEHFMSFKSESEVDKSTGGWDTFNGVKLFPQDSIGIEKKKAVDRMKINEMFNTHDRDGNGGLNRIEFSQMLKSMDMWHDFMVLTRTARKQAETEKDDQDRKKPADETKDLEEMVKDVTVPMDLLKYLPLLSAVDIEEETVAKLGEIWNGLKNKDKRLPIQNLEQLLVKTGFVDEGDAHDEAQRYINFILTDNDITGRETYLSKQQYLQSLFCPIGMARYQPNKDISRVLGLIAGYPLQETWHSGKKVATPYRSSHLGMPVATQLNKRMFSIAMPVLRYFLELRGEEDRHRSGLTFGEFAKLPEVLPRVKDSPFLRNADTLHDTFNKFKRRTSPTMSLPRFATMFSGKLKIPGAAHDELFISVDTFLRAPELKLPKSAESVAQFDAMIQAEYEAQREPQGDGTN